MTDMTHPTTVSGPASEMHQHAGELHSKGHFPPPMPPGFRLPPGVKIENGRPTPKWGDLADAPFHAIAGDRVSSLLQRVRVSTVPMGVSEMSGRWGVALPPIPCAYVAVTRGRLFFRSDHQGPFELRAGECAVTFQPTGLTLTDSPDSPVVSALSMLGPDHMKNHSGLRAGQGEVSTCFLGGPLLFDSGVGGPLRSALPEVIPLCAGEPGIPHDSKLVQGVVGLLEPARRDPRPGSGALLNQLVTILVIEAMRSHLQRPGIDHESWSGALFDEHLGPMLSLLHSSPARPWTLQEMANESGLSRTVFAERFQRVVGSPPATYVRTFRMEMAKDILRTTATDVRAIARRVGYSSEAAFCNVFKKSTGLTPSEYREKTKPDPLVPPGGSAAPGNLPGR